MSDVAISGLTDLGAALATNDLFVTVDVSDTTQSSAGSTKKVLVSEAFTTPNFTTSVTVTGASASALTVGLNGATTPAFQVDASTASQAAGLKVTGAATGGTVAVVAIDSGSNTNLTINAKGTGTIGIGTVSTGAVTITPATTITGALTVSGGAASIFATAANAQLVMQRVGNDAWRILVDNSNAWSLTDVTASVTAITISNAGAVVVPATLGVTGAVVFASTLGVFGVTTLAALAATTGGFSTSATVTSASAVALAVGLAGATNPAFVVDSSTGTQASGLKVTGSTASGTVAVAAISSGADTSLTINAKGVGTIGIGSVSTGAVTITPATTISAALTVNAVVQLGGAASANLITIGGASYGAGVASLRLNGLTDAGGGNTGTLTNCPHTGNPAFWWPVNIAGTVYAVPCFSLT